MFQENIEDAIVQAKDIVAIQVGERRFETSRKTLQPTKWESLEEKLGYKTLADGTKLYLLDMDGDMFSHLLRWLRHGIVPTFINGKGEPDFAMYSVLHNQADMFGAVGLRDFIREKSWGGPVWEGDYYEPQFPPRHIDGWYDEEDPDENHAYSATHGWSGEETEHEGNKRTDRWGSKSDTSLHEHSCSNDSNETIAATDGESSTGTTASHKL